MDTGAIISTLGGPKTIASLLGVSRQAVTNWPREGIPYKHWPALQAAGIPLDALQATRAPAPAPEPAQ